MGTNGRRTGPLSQGIQQTLEHAIIGMVAWQRVCKPQAGPDLLVDGAGRFVRHLRTVSLGNVVPGHGSHLSNYVSSDVWLKAKRMCQKDPTKGLSFVT